MGTPSTFQNFRLGTAIGPDETKDESALVKTGQNYRALDMRGSQLPNQTRYRYVPIFFVEDGFFNEGLAYGRAVARNVSQCLN